MLHKKYIHFINFKIGQNYHMLLKIRILAILDSVGGGDKVIRLKGSVHLPTSKPNHMQTGVCSKESRSLLVEEMVPSP